MIIECLDDSVFLAVLHDLSPRYVGVMWEDACRFGGVNFGERVDYRDLFWALIGGGPL